MTTATCPRGHESATDDYCDVCGVPMARRTAAPAADGTRGPTPASAVPVESAGARQPASGGPVPEPESDPAQPCPVCGTPQTGRFCEEDGYDFLLAPQGAPASPAASPAAVAPVAATGGTPDGTDPAPAGKAAVERAPTGAGPPPAGQGDAWQLTVAADREYFDLVRSLGGADAEGLTFPRFVVERRFTLERRQLLIGRRSRSRGVHPDVDLVGPPEDPGVSHLHALLLPHEDGWEVVDLESANGTYLNDPCTAPIAANTPVRLGDGDRVYLGAWTRLTFRADV